MISRAPPPAIDARADQPAAGDYHPQRLVDEKHVEIGHGRFYSDVPPVKGLYMGGASSELNAAVTMSRLDPQTSARA